MYRATFLASALTLALTAGASHAQQAPSAMMEAENDDVIVEPFGITIDQLDDYDVYGVGGEEIGEVDDVLVDQTGQPVALAIEVGGFLGVGGKEVIVPLEQISVQSERVILDMSREQIEALEEWRH